MEGLIKCPWGSVSGRHQLLGAYSPVANWTTLRLFFILSIIMGWYSKQMDFVLAYPHPPAEVPFFYEFSNSVSIQTRSV